MAGSHANHLSTLTRKLYGLKGSVNAKVMAAVAEELIAEGQRLVDKAGAEGSYNNRLNNLRQSIGSCLFIDGKEYKGPSQFAKEFKSNLARFEAHGWDTAPVRREGYSRRFYQNAAPSLKPRKFPDGEEMDGDDAINKFFTEYEAPKGVWQLVVAAAMFYGAAVESKGYRVIYFIGTEMFHSEVYRKYKASIGNVPNRFDLSGGL